MSVWVGCVVGGGRGGCRDITESYGGDQVNLSYWRTKILLPHPHPHPFPQVMNNDQPPFSYLFIYIFYSFILFIYLFFL